MSPVCVRCSKLGLAVLFSSLAAPEEIKGEEQEEEDEIEVQAVLAVFLGLAGCSGFKWDYDVAFNQCLEDGWKMVLSV